MHCLQIRGHCVFLFGSVRSTVLVNEQTLCIIRRNHSYSASHFAYSYTFLCSVVCLSLCLSHSCTLLKLFDGFRCHLAGTFFGSSDTLCWMGVPDPRGRGDLGGWTTNQNMQLQILCCHLANTNGEQFHLLPNYFGSCFSLAEVCIFLMLCSSCGRTS